MPSRWSPFLLGALLAVSFCVSPAASAAERRTVRSELARMLERGAIDQVEHDERRAVHADARRVLRRLSGARAVALGGVLRNLDRIAAQGSLTVSRLEPLWLTLRRNREWWTRRELLPGGARVSFPGSELVWQHYPGHGLQIQPLANFGKLNALWASRRSDDRLEVLLDELLALAVDRAGGLAWEYAFPIGGGRFPWVSGLAQGTAAQALSRAGIRLRRKGEVMPFAGAALGVFREPPPSGVRIDRPRGGPGAHYLLYSSHPSLRVLNGFAQALVGIFDYAKYANDDEARSLFADGERALRREAPLFDTGAWSLYAARGSEASLNYHNLNRDFLRSLCRRTALEPYCSLEARFTAYLAEPPVLELETTRLRGGRSGRLSFALSKVSTVSLTIRRGSTLVRSTSAYVGRGERFFVWDVPRRAGIYEVTLRATDLAGNAGETSGDVEVLRPAKRRRAPRETTGGERRR